MEAYELRVLLHSLDMEKKKFLKPLFLEQGLIVGKGQPKILKNLLQKGEMTQKELADCCFLDVTTMSRTIDRMEKSGLLYRKNHPECRRSYLICLTDEGKEKAQRVCEIFEKLDEKMWRGISSGEMRELGSILKKVNKNLEE